MLSRLMTRREQLVLLALAASALLGAFSLFLLRGQPDQPAITPAITIEQPATPPPIAEAATQREPAPATPTPVTPTPASPPPETSRPSAVSEPAGGHEAPGSKSIRVAIQGEVEQPGLYTMAADDRVQDLIDAAGGLNPGADTSTLNIAAHLLDGTTLVIPRGTYGSVNGGPATMRSASRTVSNPPQYLIGGQGTASGPGAAASSGAAASQSPYAGGARAPGAPASAGLIDINRASQAQLETLPGVGPATAQKIMNYREAVPFRTVDELENVSGIGPKKMEALRPLITAGPR